jgi:hypothetical protein
LRFALFTAMLAMASSGILCAQTGTALALEDPSVLRAKFNVEKIRTMVEAGTLPRVRLEKAEADLADAQDESFITRALYGKDMTEEQAAETVRAAERRVERRKKNAILQQEYLAQGIISQSELKYALDDLERVNKELAWAMAREKLVAEVAKFAAAEIALMKQMEEGAITGPNSRIERYMGKGDFTVSDFAKVQRAFFSRFAKSLPVSANGETAVHRSLGFDHRNRVDVAVMPDGPEGLWLRHYLTANRIPYFAFRNAVAHQATGAHIHMGPPSTRFVQARVGSGVSTGGN